MKPWEKYTFSGLAALLTLSGGAYFWMKYLLQPADPFAVVNHPLQGLMLQLHVLAAPAFLVMFGIIFNSHIGRKIGRTIPNRKSGLLSLATLGVMTLSGYLLQVVSGDVMRQVSFLTHLVSGGIFAVAYTTHLAISVRMWARARAAQHADAVV